MQKFACPIAPAKEEPNIPEGPDYEKKYQDYIDERGEFLPTPRDTPTAVVTSK